MEHAAVTRAREDITTIAVPSEQAIPLVESQFMRHWHRDRFAVRSQSHHGTVAQRLLSADMDDTHADGLRYVDLVARYYVGAPTDAFREISDFSIWFFIWDDQHGRYALQRRDQQWCRLRDALHRVLDKPSLHVKNADPLVPGLSIACSVSTSLWMSDGTGILQRISMQSSRLTIKSTASALRAIFLR